MRWLSGIAIACGLVCAGMACGSGFTATGDDGGPGDSSLVDGRYDGTLGDASGDSAPAPDAGQRLDAPAEGISVDGGTPCDPMTSQCATVPSGWTGPIEVYLGSGPPPQCDTGYDGGRVNGSASFDASPAQCGCACGPAAGLACSSPTVSFYRAALCDGSPCETQQFEAGACGAIGPGCLTQLSSASILPSVVVDGGCPPQPTIDVPDATWGSGIAGCMAGGATQQGCSPGAVCVPKAMTPFEPRLCVSAPGDGIPCPAVYTNQTVYYEGFQDNRGCTQCSCGLPTLSCFASLQVYSSGDVTCSGGVIAVVSSVQSCGPFNGVTPTDPAELTLDPPDAATCLPSAVASTGAANPSSAVTFCCQP
jgi:hypothetical protein